MKIPEHLEHLRTDRKGRPVPYINLWGDGSDSSRLRVVHDRIIHQRAVVFDDDPEGEPDFTKQSMQRQRQCMLYGRCQVCIRPLAWEHRRLVIPAISVEQIQLKDVPVYTVTEPWLCPDCATFSLSYCPGLIRRQRAEDCAVIDRITEAGTTPVISSGWIEGPYEATTKQYPAAMWVKLMLTDVRIRVRR